MVGDDARGHGPGQSGERQRRCPCGPPMVSQIRLPPRHMMQVIDDRICSVRRSEMMKTSRIDLEPHDSLAAMNAKFREFSGTVRGGALDWLGICGGIYAKR